MLARIGKVSGVLLDLSGTLFIEKTPTRGALAALDRLRRAGLPVQFITNTSKESRQLLFSRLQEIGFGVKEDEVYTCLTAARQVIEQDGLRPMFLVDPAAMEDFSGVDTSDPNCVVLGLAPTILDYEHLNEAFRLILNGARLIAIHKTRYYKRPEGLALGPGPFAAALEYACNKKAEVVGKPDKNFYLSAQARLKCPLEETVMIGDDVINDIHGAQVLGMKAILVKTGKYRVADEQTIEPPPIAVCEDFAEAVDLILSPS